VKIFSAQIYFYVAIFVKTFVLKYGYGNLSPTVVNNTNWSICEHGTEETFGTKTEGVTEIKRSSPDIFMVIKYA
jgi:hypothetical protein